MALGNVNSADVIKVRGDDLFQLPVLIKDGGVPEIQKSVLKFTLSVYRFQILVKHTEKNASIAKNYFILEKVTS